MTALQPGLPLADRPMPRWQVWLLKYCVAAGCLLVILVVAGSYTINQLSDRLSLPLFLHPLTVWTILYLVALNPLTTVAHIPSGVRPYRFALTCLWLLLVLSVSAYGWYDYRHEVLKQQLFPVVREQMLVKEQLEAREIEYDEYKERYYEIESQIHALENQRPSLSYLLLLLVPYLVYWFGYGRLFELPRQEQKVLQEPVLVPPPPQG